MLSPPLPTQGPACGAVIFIHDEIFCTSPTRAHERAASISKKNPGRNEENEERQKMSEVPKAIRLIRIWRYYGSVLRKCFLISQVCWATDAAVKEESCIYQNEEIPSTGKMSKPSNASSIKMWQPFTKSLAIPQLWLGCIRVPMHGFLFRLGMNKLKASHALPGSPAKPSSPGVVDKPCAIADPGLSLRLTNCVWSILAQPFLPLWGTRDCLYSAKCYSNQQIYVL